MKSTAKKLISYALLFALIAIPLNGCLWVTIPGPPPGIGKWDAIEILVGEIIPPAASEDRISAFMLSEPLQAGDVVTSESGGNNYPINTSTWFIFIDDYPEADFTHATRYVFMDAQDGSYTIVNETWPPMINGYSMWWDTQSLGRGHLIELWSVLDIPVPLTPVASDAPEADYGDAPDGQYASYGIPGQFPTLFATANSHFGLPGGHTLNVGEETLGLRVSAEVDALDPFDPDGMPNLVDSDRDERIYAILEQDQARLAFTVSVSLGAPDMTRHANALIDFDYSGNWSTGAYGVEWVVVNLDVDVDPGDSETILTPLFAWSNPTVPPSGVWMRLALTRTEVDESLFANVGGWDGSGQYAYGEIEDKFVFLTDMPPLPEGNGWPPPPPNGNGNGNGDDNGGTPPTTTPPPGPEKGPCGYDINYYYIIINCGDNSKSTHMKGECDDVEKLFKDQKYDSGDYLKPDDGTNTLANIQAKLKAIRNKVKCADRVLVFIRGHGNGKTIGIYNSARKRIGEITPAQINTWLDIPQCDGKECDVEKESCFVDIVITSCHAQAFLDGLKREGRTVVVSSTVGYGWGGAGGYPVGFIKDMRSIASDNDPKDGSVTVKEAHKTAAAHQKKHHPTADADISAQQCDCICPCVPGIDVDKWVWYEPYGRWVDEIEAPPGQLVTFRLEIENDGECRDIVDIEVVDILPYCLEYGYEAIIYYDGGEYPRPPDGITQEAEGLQLTWHLQEIEALAPGESIAIEYVAYAVSPGANINILFGSAHCAYDYSNIVTDQDTATVWVTPPPVGDVLSAGLEWYAECICDEFGCDSFFDIFFEVQDLTLGDYPVTSVILRIDGVIWHDWESIGEVYHSGSVHREADCGQTIHIELVAMNLVSVEPLIVTGSFTTPAEWDVPVELE